jgi:hypothetical protein
LCWWRIGYCRRAASGDKHRHWFERSALGDLPGAGAVLADVHTLYACHERLPEHKGAVFDHLHQHAGADRAHEGVTDLRTRVGLVEQRVLPVHDGSLQTLPFATSFCFG